jgi:aminopeptidase-like protein
MKKKKYRFKLMNWAQDLFPYCRSLASEGNRKTLKYIKNLNNNFKLKSVKSGEIFFDWTVPQEWQIKQSYILSQEGKKIANFKENNLHVVNYSRSINKKINYNLLKKKVFTLKNNPNAIPYVTSYYYKNWGFCLKFNDFKKLNKKQKYLAYIQSKHFNGKMDYAELTIKGKSTKTILICSYICHPSLANNELSGPLIIAALSKILRPSKYTVKLILIPETIGAITYISKNLQSLKKNLVAGFNLSCVGDGGPYSLVSSINENTYADKVANRVLGKKNNFKKYSFMERGSNERQFGCQNLNLPFVTICRSKFGTYKEYHTSDDNLSFISEKNLQDSLKCVLELVEEVQKNKIFIKNTICEPFLTKHNLVSTTGTGKSVKFRELQNVIAYIGTNYDLKELSKKLNIPFVKIKKIINIIQKKKIIKEYL